MPKYKLTKYEQETIINYNQEEKTVDVYTHDPALIRHYENKLGLTAIETNEWGGKTFVHPKKWLRKAQKPRKLTGDKLKKAQERMKKLHEK